MYNALKLIVILFISVVCLSCKSKSESKEGAPEAEVISGAVDSSAFNKKAYRPKTPISFDHMSNTKLDCKSCHHSKD